MDRVRRGEGRTGEGRKWTKEGEKGGQDSVTTNGEEKKVNKKRRERDKETLDKVRKREERAGEGKEGGRKEEGEKGGQDSVTTGLRKTPAWGGGGRRDRSNASPDLNISRTGQPRAPAR